MKMNNLLNKASTIVGVIGIITTLIGIGISLEGIKQPPCTVENIIADEGATVNINCTVTP